MTGQLAAFRTAELNLDALAATARDLLRHARLRVDDGRVANAPDARGIRYYQTLGVLDRPLRYDGRRAVYGYRHLLQLLAIRRLQGEGYPLAVIQTTLPSKSTAELETSLARVFEGARGEPAGAAVALVDPDRAGHADEAARLVASLSVPPRRVLSGEVVPGVTLTIDPGRVAGAHDLYARVAEHVARLMKEA